MSKSLILRRLEAVERKLNKLNVRGIVDEIDPEMGIGGCVRIRYGDNQLSDWLPVKPLRSGKSAIWWFPDVGEGVTITDLEIGEVLPGSFTTDCPPPTRDPDVLHIQFADGASIAHNRKENTLKIINIGDISAETPKKIKMKADGGFELIGDIEHQGNQHTTGDIKGDKDITDKKRSMADDREIYNGHKHPSSSPHTGTPTSQQ